MTRIFNALFVVLAWSGATAAIGADVTFFEHEGFRGRSFNANQTIPNFADIGFNDRAASVIVRSGSWQLCADAYFRGRCVSVNPGEYPSLRTLQLENQVSSARELDWIVGSRPPGAASSARIELFEGTGFSGRQFGVNATISNFGDIGFNDRAQSMIVHDGAWEACEHADFRGACHTFGPGRYPTLAQFGGRISSLRAVAAGGVGGWGTGARALLYEGPNLSGRSFVINNDVVYNLGTTGFNDRASSMRIEAGYWMFCSEANFSGECLTFGPGDYSTLPRSLNNRISSGRRIHQQYPYNQNPAWQR